MPGPHEIPQQLGLASPGGDGCGSARTVVVGVSVVGPGSQDQIAGLEQAGEFGGQPTFGYLSVGVTQPEGSQRRYAKAGRRRRRLQGAAVTQLSLPARMAVFAVGDGDEHHVDARCDEKGCRAARTEYLVVGVRGYHDAPVGRWRGHPPGPDPAELGTGLPLRLGRPGSVQRRRRGF